MKIYGKVINNLLKIIYFDSLFAYGENIQRVDTLEGLKNETVLIESEQLNSEIIDKLKNGNNKIIAFDINDNSCFCYSYSENPKILDIDLIFKFAGIQKEYSEVETSISSDCSYGLKPSLFMNEVNQSLYSELKSKNKLFSLPYVLWEDKQVPIISWKDRKKLVLVRGGHHYNRVHLLFNLIRKNKVDGNSSFNTYGYINQYCDSCKKMMSKGKMTLEKVKETESSCRMPNPIPSEYFQSRGDWNNQCPSRYFEMAEVMGINREMVENVLNGNYLSGEEFYKTLSNYTMYSDLKWIFSIYIPPRFWEAASARTVNLYSNRTKNQIYFPELIESEHYVSFKEDFSNLEEACDLSEQKYKEISENCYALYDYWIRGGKYKLSTNLMDHILNKIKEIEG